jgi:hypothetical protein
LGLVDECSVTFVFSCSLFSFTFVELPFPPVFSFCLPLSETAKSKEKSSDSKSQVLDKPVESENKGKSDSKSMEIDSTG